MQQNPTPIAPLTQGGHLTVDYIRHNLEYFTRPFPSSIVHKAVRYKAEITPALLDFLKYALNNPNNLSSNYMGHLYALFLLAEFRETQAFPLVMQLLKLPEKSLDILLGDVITEDCHNIIASVYNGDMAIIQQLIEDPNVYTWSRNAALNSLLTLVKEGVIEREFVIDYFGTLFDNINFNQDPNAITSLVDCACNLYPLELYDKIKVAYQQGLVDEWWIKLSWVDKQIALGQDAVLAKKIFNKDHYGYIRSTVESMEGWACFAPPEQPQTVTGYKIGRNDPCPCGSGKKYKKCCLS